MPLALLRPCSAPECPELVASGRCLTHTRTHERARLAARREQHGACDYNSPRWRDLRDRFRRALIAAGVVPACGAKLPGAPLTQDSTAQREGRLLGDAEHRRLTGHRLNLDHIVPHRGDEALFWDLDNLQLLSDADHNRKSQREKA